MSKAKQKPRFLPEEFVIAHDLCYMNHDIILEILRSGERSRIFEHKIKLKDEADRKAFEASASPFDWLFASKRTQELGDLLRKVVFPALLSDFLQFIYQALATSGQGHLVVTYTLLRKPLQESLHLIETIIVDIEKFTVKLATEPQELYHGKSGGVDAHKKRIEEAIASVNASTLFDASYLAALRYDKNYSEGFASLFDPAIHLFTDHKAIKTEPLNINFIFSGQEQKWTQQAFLYSRLPYVLSYARILFEKLLAHFIQTDPVYLADIDRRVAAATLLWSETIPEDFIDEPITKFIDVTRAHLFEQCRSMGYRVPSQADLVRMQKTGSWPGESRIAASARNLRYSKNALANKTSRAIDRLTTKLIDHQN